MSFEIDLQFTDYGMSPAKVSLDGSNAMVFTDNDYFIVEPCKGSQIFNSYHDSITNTDTVIFDRTEFSYFNGYPIGSYITANMTFMNAEFGIILRYSYDGFLIVRFDGSNISLCRVVNDSVEEISKPTSCELVSGTTYSIKVEDMTDRIKVYIDDIFKTSFIVTNELIDEGLFGVYGAKDTVCTQYSISSLSPNSWTKVGSLTTIGYEDAIDNDSRIVVSSFDDNSSLANYVYQDITVTSSKMYSYLIAAGGESYPELTNPGKIEIWDKTNSAKITEILIDKVNHYDVYKYSGNFTTPAACTQISIRIIPLTKSTVCVDKLQINEGDIMPFIKTTTTTVAEGSSQIDLPVKIDSFNDITIITDFKPYSDASNKKNTIVSLENGAGKFFIVYYDINNKICIDFNDGTSTYSYPTELLLNLLRFNNVNINIVDNTVEIMLNEDDENIVILSPSDPAQLIPSYIVETIYLGYTNAPTGYYRANGMYDNFIVKNPTKELCNYKFDGAVQEVGNGITITIPGKPQQFAPIAVEYQNGESLFRISSFDDEGNYTRNAIEYVKYTGQKKLTVSCHNIEFEYSAPHATIPADETNEGGYDIGFNAVSVDGNTIYLDMTDEQSRKYIGKTMKITYVPKDSYSVTYNEDNSFNITLHSHNGSPMTVSYEEAMTDHTLIKSANMNPFYNPKNTGFLYLTDELEEVSYLEVTVTPNYIDAKSGEYSLIIIDAYDKNGNPVSNADLSLNTSNVVDAEITRISTGKQLDDTVTKGRTDIQFCAGRYIYSYKLKELQNSKSSYIIKDVITIIENSSKVTESASIYIYV